MGRKITLNQNEMRKFVSMIVEQVDVNGYSEEDFVEVFLQTFRPWIKQYHGDEVSKYPMSLLVKKYLDDFVKDHDIVDRYYGSGLSKLSRIGREIATQGKYELPSLSSNVKFTEKFRRPLTFITEYLDFPSYITLKFTEPSPQKVKCEIIVDWEKLIKSTQRTDVHSINQQLKKYLGDYLGVEFGSPQHGHLELYVINSPTYIGRDEWIKTVFNKEIKKEFKKIPNAEHTISSLKFIPDDSRMYADIKIGWKRSSRWSNQSSVGDAAREILKNMGYNTNILRVQT
jgi:hypothetical protein